ncbi:type II secretion system minor pseudopilin GspK [Thalassococcus sp. BH17M4-6]|uniref:type II secretion system minor pseudopilin GspK n=1 Tax=Thalassococcus sp. BH17M4-6 TaxID=3413148 RepID=UPI003BCF4335
MSPRNGFVLVNALVLVAALAGIATFLLARAEGARARAFEAQGAAQARLYLDAFEALSIGVLTSDRAGGAMDHPGEDWANSDYDVPLDRGRVAGEIADMQALFNVNWLANPSDTLARDGFELLVTRLGLRPGLAEEIPAFLSQNGPADKSAYARADPPLRPVGGPVVFLDQLLDMRGLSLRDLDRLRPYLTALPGAQPLNVNTAPALVLQAMMPEIGPVVADRLLQSRRLEPFVSVDDFIMRLGALGATAVLSEDDLPRFAVGSSWFRADIRATLDGHSRHRVTVFERPPLPAGIRVAYRLADVP